MAGRDTEMGEGRVVFEGRLLEMPSEAPRCGDIKVAVAYRFQIERMVQGTHGREPVVVLIPCPDLQPPGFFEAGARYRVEATADLAEARSHTVFNDYPASSPWWAVSLARLDRTTG